jgi:hypothetical protein
MSDKHYKAGMRMAKFSLAVAATVYTIIELYTHFF